MRNPSSKNPEYSTRLECGIRSMIITLKIKKICFSPKVSIQPCRPKSDSTLPGAIYEDNLDQKSSIKRLFQPTAGPIPAHGRAHFSPGTNNNNFISIALLSYVQGALKTKSALKISPFKTKSALANWTVLAPI